MAAAFRRHGLPVMLVNVTGGAPERTEAGKARSAGSTQLQDYAELVDELGGDPGEALPIPVRSGGL
jgi:hypothetical protein